MSLRRPAGVEVTSPVARSLFRRYLLLWLCLLGGAAPESRAIIHGVDTDPAHNPLAAHVVALQMSERQPDGTLRYYKGSAVVLAPRVVLTAGHNVAYLPNPRQVEVILSAAPCWGVNVCGERRIGALRTRAHPQFHQISGGTEFDLALVLLSTELPAPYAPLPLPRKAEVLDDTTLEVLGYGTDRESDDAPAKAFRLRVVGLSASDEAYRLGDNQKFWLDQSNRGICAGDSGGPAILERGGKALVGIAIHVTYSGGIAHCLTRGAFTDVLFFAAWIRGSLSELLSQP